MTRHKTKVIHLGNVPIGGNNPISIQSMTKSDTRDLKAVVKEIHGLEELGCDIIRVSIPDNESAKVLPEIIKRINVPLVADIHFDWRLAVKAIENGASGIRINPGNIDGKKEVREIVKTAKDRNVVIRVGVNSGSVKKGKTLVGSALEYINMIEDMGYTQMKVSLKAPDIQRTIDAYRLISREVNYPLHIGVTEAGPLVESAVRSSIAIGTLLMEGIGDTIRVSVTGESSLEVVIAKEILQSLGLRRFGPQIISCPTCARCEVDLVNIVERVKELLPLTGNRVNSIAIMGCVVNGPGEARDADIGIACGRGSGVLFKKGKPVRKVLEKDIVKVLIDEME